MPQKAHLLVVDDEANTLASLARAFRLAGHEAMVCDNAAKGLELAKSQNFDLILSDVVMPGKDGLWLLEDLKNEGVAAPVVMMSGQAHIEMAVKATRLGALDFLEKPIATEKLLLTLDNALDFSGWRAKIVNSSSDSASMRSSGRAKPCARHGANRSRGPQRNAGLHSRGNWHGERIGSTHIARAESREPQVRSSH